MSLRKNFSIGVLLAGLSAIGFQATGGLNKTSGGHPGSTGAPGELTCAQSGCHANASISQGDSINLFTLQSSDTLYKSGKTYDFKLRVTRPGVAKFGFMITALSDRDSLKAGDIKISQPTRTLLVGGPKNRQYITHTSNGTIPTEPGEIEWTFQWTAPATNRGPVTFYIVSNCTNKDNTNSGDALFFSQWKMDSDPANPTVGISERARPLPGRIYAANGHLIIQPTGEDRLSGTIRLTDLKGATVWESPLQERMALPARLNGVYLYTVASGGQVFAGKVMVGG